MRWLTWRSLLACPYNKAAASAAASTAEVALAAAETESKELRDQLMKRSAALASAHGTSEVERVRLAAAFAEREKSVDALNDELRAAQIAAVGRCWPLQKAV